MDKIMCVLEALAAPAFFWKEGKILRANSACKNVPLAEGESFSLPDSMIPRPGQTFQGQTAAGAGTWNFTASAMEDGEVFLTLTSAAPEEDVPVLSAATRSLRDPLSSLLTSCSALFARLEEEENETFQEMGSAVSRSFFRLFRVNTMLRDTCRMAMGEGLYVEKTDLKRFFDDHAILWADCLADAGIRLEYKGPEKPFKGNIDRYLLQCAVLHLLSNAAIYHEQDTAVSLCVSYMAGRMKIQVENRGKPMPPEVFATVFTRHQQLPQLEDGRWGSGLGLHLAKSVAQYHGGTVLIQSEDGGTKVTMVLDLTTPETTVSTPFVDLTAGFDPALVILSDVLPDETYDSRNINM